MALSEFRVKSRLESAALIVSLAIQWMAWPLCLEDWNLLDRDRVSLSMSIALAPRLLI